MKLLQFVRENFPKSVMENTHDEGDRFGLPHPYTVPSPGDIFDCMFYWDTHFTNVGLIPDGNIRQAIYNTDNIRHMILRFGYMPNSTKSHHLGKSQPPLYYRMVSDIFDVTQDTSWLATHYDVIAREYQFWMTERIAPNGLNYYGRVVSDIPEDELQKRFAYCKTRFQGFDSSDRQTMINAVNTVSSLCESGWDCCYRFEMSGPDYNPVDLNSLLYGLESTMAQFSRILGRGEEDLWLVRATKRKEKMDQFLYSKELGFYTDWNYVRNAHSPVISCASLFPLYVGLCHDPQAIMAVLRKEMLLPWGVTGTTKPDHPYTLQWEYPKIWAPLQYVACQACLCAGEEALARDIAFRYCNLLEQSFEKTGGLWEKYNGLTGQVDNSEYNSPPMLGWTAGVYLFFKHFLLLKS